MHHPKAYIESIHRMQKMAFALNLINTVKACPGKVFIGATLVKSTGSPVYVNVTRIMQWAAHYYRAPG